AAEAEWRPRNPPFVCKPEGRARNVSGQHKEEIDALGGVGGSPSCCCHQRGNHEGLQGAHYVDTVLHCEQPGRLSPQRRRREPQSLSCPSPPLASGATSGPGS